MDITRFIVSQREKGLSVGDYAHYRKQLSRRLLVVRKKLNYTTSGGKKYTPRAPITSANLAENHEFVHLFLLTSERAWAQAMYMKSTHSADSTAGGLTRSTKNHIQSRLHRACTYAERLVEALKNTEISKATAEAILEARAYYLSLLGATKFEKHDWERCLKAFAESRVIYTSLAGSQSSTEEDLFRDFLNTTLDPSIRYAAYQLKIPRTTSIESVVVQYVSREENEYLDEIIKRDPEALHDPAVSQNKTSSGRLENVPQTIEWRSRTVNLEDAATAQALAAVSAAENKLSAFLSSNKAAPFQTKAAAYDEVLLPSQDAVDATKTAIDELSAEGIQQSDRRMQSLQITRTAVNYALIGWRIGRNRVLCGPQDGSILEPLTQKLKGKSSKKTKPTTPRGGEESINHKLKRLRERVALYDATLQSIDSIQDLPGVAADTAFVTALSAKRAYFSSLRCLAIARSHGLLQAPQNALALLARATEYLSSIRSASLNSTDIEKEPPNLHVSQTHTATLQTLLERLLLHHRALVTLHNLSPSTPAAQASSGNPTPVEPPLVERLDSYPSTPIDLTNLVSYPPKIQPIPVKPLFLDVAWNYIDYPGKVGKKINRDGRVEKSTADEDTGKGKEKEKEKEGRRGWFGFGR